MKFIRFKTANFNEPRYGCLVDGEVKTITGSLFGEHTIGEAVGSLEDVQLLAPSIPTKIIGLAANYHGATGVTEEMKEPNLFVKPGTSACGPNDDVVCCFKDAKVWGESELGIVIGKRVKKISESEARESIFGYLCANDVTAHNIEGRDWHLLRSKGADTFCPVGPWIDTEFDPSKAQIEGWQNGDLIRQAKLKDRIWSDEKIVSWLSEWLTLEVGDIIITGAPPRVVEKRYLEEGDIYEVKIEGLGELKNKFTCDPKV